MVSISTSLKNARMLKVIFRILVTSCLYRTVILNSYKKDNFVNIDELSDSLEIEVKPTH